nr:hypothetical protein [Nanoarchaeum sp.]
MYNIYRIIGFKVDYYYRIMRVFNRGDAIIAANSTDDACNLLEEILSTPEARKAGLKEFDITLPKEGIVNTRVSADTRGVIYAKCGPSGIEYKQPEELVL